MSYISFALLLEILAANKPTFLSLRKCFGEKSGKIHSIYLNGKTLYRTWDELP